VTRPAPDRADALAVAGLDRETPDTLAVAGLDRETPDAVAPAGAVPRAHSPMTQPTMPANRSLAVTGSLLMSHDSILFRLKRML
jgi:hypothetical protein